MPKLKLGCVADDFTGASDMASFLVKGGLNTVMVDGIPPDDFHLGDQVEAVVIALKSRTAPTTEAVDMSMACFRWLKQQGNAEQLFFKYCSTFDSTSEGNIGPVVDAVLNEFKLPCALISPALPVNGRTVYQGYLFVNGQLLSDSSMRFHPLTPMLESNLCTLMEQQGIYRAVNIPHTLIESGADKVTTAIKRLAPEQRYLVVDHFNARHAEVIVQALSDQPFITGSSGLAEALAIHHSQASGHEASLPSVIGDHGSTLILAGSCSEATRTQVANFMDQYPAFRIDPFKLARGQDTEASIWQWFEQQTGPCLIYSSDDPDRVSQNQLTLGSDVSELLEKTFANIARRAVSQCISGLVVAGGETSGAVTKALQEPVFLVGLSVAPGVPVMHPVSYPGLQLVLKSGNFGGDDFFLDAVQILNDGDTRSNKE